MYNRKEKRRLKFTCCDLISVKNRVLCESSSRTSRDKKGNKEWL